jgi:hypothetical protein
VSQSVASKGAHAARQIQNKSEVRMVKKCKVAKNKREQVKNGYSAFM